MLPNAKRLAMVVVAAAVGGVLGGVLSGIIYEASKSEPVAQVVAASDIGIGGCTSSQPVMVIPRKTDDSKGAVMAKSSVATMVAEIDGQIAELQRMRAVLLALLALNIVSRKTWRHVR